MIPFYKGRVGQIFEITDPNKGRNATLDAWLLHIPTAHPLWSYFILYVIHLRDVEGLPPAEIIKEGMTHQLNLWALCPDFVPDPANLKTFVALTSSNVLEQFAASTDEFARSIAYTMGMAFTNGDILAEPSGIIGAREHTRNYLYYLAKTATKGTAS